jgi:class 3 adenylate cyclase
MSPLDVDRLVAAGLYDPGAPDAGEQLNLLRLIEARGGTIEQMVRVNEAGRLSRLAAELLVVAGQDRYTAAEVAARADVRIDRFIELWRAAGFADPEPDDVRFTDAEVELVRTFDAASGLFGEAATMQLLRVVGASVSRVADATVSTFITTLGASAMAADPVTGALAEANLAAAELFPRLSAAMDGLLRHHLVDAARPNVTGVSSGFETVTATVGFVDVVGSTGLATHLPLGDIGRSIASFEEHAANAVAASGGRVVKFIGDEVMFRVHDPAAACFVALTIVARFSDDDVLPGARAGVAVGDLLVRDVDYFGPVVNVAARATKLARPGTVLATAPVRDAVPEAAGLRLVAVPPRRLKGFDAIHVSLHIGPATARGRPVTPTNAQNPRSVKLDSRRGRGLHRSLGMRHAPDRLRPTVSGVCPHEPGDATQDPGALREDASVHGARANPGGHRGRRCRRPTATRAPRGHARCSGPALARPSSLGVVTSQ